MIDTHCHLYVEDFQEDIGNVIEEAKKVGVRKFFLPAIDSKTHSAMISLEKQFPSCCFAMIGLHPCSVESNYDEELAIIEALLKERSFAAIGETGLDYHWDKTFIKEQEISLRRQVELALQYKLPLVLHTRDAMQETIDIIKTYKGSGLMGIFHCFGGTLDEANQIIDCGFLLGIGGVVTYKNAGLDKVLSEVPLNHLVLETDAPYLAPVPYRGKRNESSYLPKVVKTISAIKNIAELEVEEITTRNAEILFNQQASII